MIIVGIGSGAHDCSISMSVDGRARYCKYERESGMKHHPAPDGWFVKKINSWGVDWKDVDLVVETSTGINQTSDKINCLNGNSYLKLNESLVIDHHFAHAWSNTNMKDGMPFVVVDGSGSNHNKIKMSSFYYDGSTHQRNNMYTPGKALWAIAKCMNMVDDTKKYSYIDAAGKTMGLKSYGVVNQSLYEELLALAKFSTGMSVHKIVEYILNSKMEKTLQNSDWLSLVATVDAVCYQCIKQYFSTQPKGVEIIYAGGCALNVDWNRKLADEGYVLNIEPPVYDGGLSIGALRFGHHYLGIEQPKFCNYPYIQDDVMPEKRVTESTIDKVADLLAQGKIVGWYQGNGEVGPRALGNRSILMDPTIKDGKDILNQKVKRREPFRPFGASVIESESKLHFDNSYSPYMLFNSFVKNSDLNSVRHVDNTCRHQTVSSEQNEDFYSLLTKFNDKRGIPVLLNTSLNLGGSPIAGTPREAIDLFRGSDMDAVCIGNELFVK